MASWDIIESPDPGWTRRLLGPWERIESAGNKPDDEGLHSMWWYLTLIGVAEDSRRRKYDGLKWK